MDGFSPNNEYFQTAIKLINEYKTAEPGILKNITGTVLAPVNWLVEKLIPVSYTHLTLPTKRIV